MSTSIRANFEPDEQKKLSALLVDFLGSIIRAARVCEIKLNRIQKGSLMRDYTRAKILKDRSGNLDQSDEMKLSDILNQNWFRYELNIPDHVKGKLFDRVLSKHRQELLIKRIMFKLSSDLSEVYSPINEGKFNQLQTCLDKLESGPLLIVDELKIFNAL